MDGVVESFIQNIQSTYLHYHGRIISIVSYNCLLANSVTNSKDKETIDLPMHIEPTTSAKQQHSLIEVIVCE